MPVPVMSSVVRSILSDNINLSADEVIKLARARGVTTPEQSLRTTTHNIKSDLRKKAVKAGVKPVPAAARTTKSPEPVPVPTVGTRASAPDLTSVLANVALVNAVVGVCGGAEPARKVAERSRRVGASRRSCGTWIWSPGSGMGGRRSSWRPTRA